ncbi:MAG: hypothetical protein KBT89_13865 [Gammaproteobacteria bacterium]|nr:hypothetical protein [Gammaproteobacteria bacterium]
MIHAHSSIEFDKAQGALAQHGGIISNLDEKGMSITTVFSTTLAPSTQPTSTQILLSV